jgi:hypothetical protein
VEIGHEFLNKKASEKDDRVFTHYQPKGKKRNVREYLKGDDDRFVFEKFSNISYSQVPDKVKPVEAKPTEVKFRPIPVLDRKYIPDLQLTIENEEHSKLQLTANSIVVEVNDESRRTRSSPRQKTTSRKTGS